MSVFGHCGHWALVAFVRLGTRQDIGKVSGIGRQSGVA